MTGGRPSVAVVVPAYNAGGTIIETLRSVSAQTYEDMEILVVDDGSRDNTAELVERYQREEPRLRLIRQANAGVAAARNTGMAHATAPYIAPIDSDDLWHPTKVEKHVEALERNPAAAFAYSPFRIMNGDGRVIDSHPFFAFERRVFFRQLFFNMVGNGSGMTFRRDAALAMGGYDVTLRDLGLQGCEDWLLQMLLALDHEVAHVPEYLIGYRKVPGAMSADTNRMWRSRILAADILRESAPPSARPLIDSAKLNFSTRLAFQSLRKTDPRQIVDTVGVSVQLGEVDHLMGEFGEVFVRARRTKARRGRPGPKFAEVDPKALGKNNLSAYTRQWIARLQQADESPSVFDHPDEPPVRLSAAR